MTASAQQAGMTANKRRCPVQVSQTAALKHTSNMVISKVMESTAV